MQKCLLCEEESSGHLFSYNCPSCGKYNIEQFEYGQENANRNTNGLFVKYKEIIRKNLHNIRGFLKEKEMEGHIFTITVDNFQKFIDQKDISFDEKLNKLLKFIINKKRMGDTFFIDDNGLKFSKLKVSGNVVEENLTVVIWGEDRREVYCLVDEMLSLGYFRRENNGDYNITMKGYDHIKNNKNEQAESYNEKPINYYINSQINSGNFERSPIIKKDTIVEYKNEESLKKYLLSLGADRKDLEKLIKLLSSESKPKDKSHISSMVTNWIKETSSNLASGLVISAVIKYFGF